MLTLYLTSTASDSSCGLDVSMATSTGDLPCGWGGGLLPWWPLAGGFDMATESFTLQNIPVTFTCDIEFYVLTIAQNVAIFIITIIIPTAGAYFRWISHVIFED